MASRKPRCGSPTTIRLLQSDLEWVREAAQSHPDGVSGVIRAALQLYRDHLNDKSDMLASVVIRGSRE